MIDKAIKSLRPDARWMLHGDEYEGLEWLDDDLPPTKEEVESEVARLLAVVQDTEYQRLREKEYPSYADQFDLLYHGGYDAWKETIQAVKDKYPKP